VSLPPFTVNFDYRCPFARIVHDHLILGLQGGAEWEVSFEPFTLSQGHIAPGHPAVWEDPARAGDLVALEASLAVRDHFPERFGLLHQALFAARHDEANPLRETAQVDQVLRDCGLDPEAVAAFVATGAPKAEIAEAWTRRTTEQQVFGVPTFFVGDAAVFIRLMERPNGDPAASIATIDRLVGLIAEHPELNEFKHTTLSR